MDHALYAVDLSRWVFNGEIDQAWGLIENRVHANLSVEDYGVALMRLLPSSGHAPVSLVFEDTWAADPSAGGGTSRQQIIGTHGSLRPDGDAWVVTRGGKDEARHPIPAAPFFDFEALAGLLESSQTPPFGSADARANLEACLRVYDAAPSRRS
jgi:predicted dehydrogenase